METRLQKKHRITKEQEETTLKALILILKNSGLLGYSDLINLSATCKTLNSWKQEARFTAANGQEISIAQSKRSPVKRTIQEEEIANKRLQRLLWAPLRPEAKSSYHNNESEEQVKNNHARTRRRIDFSLN